MSNALLDPSALQWRCRRGMLELDLFLIPFGQNRYATLTLFEKKTFARLLEENDVDLFKWLMGQTVCEDTEFRHIIPLIREYRLKR